MQQGKDFLKYIALFVLISALTSCGGNSACIDADDFGFTTVTVSARYDSSDIIGTGENELAPWRDFDLTLSGDPIVIMVKNWRYGEDINNSKVLSAWCPWWGTNGQDKILSTFCKRLQQCRYINNEKCHAPVIENIPCLMKQGVGLYVDLEPWGAPSPNANQITMKAPQSPSITLHLGEPTQGYKMYDVSGAGVSRTAGGILYNYDGNNSLNSNRLHYVNGKMYFKILDSYYRDNNGQYLVIIKSGLQKPGGDLFTMIETLVQKQLFGNGNAQSSTLEQNGVVRTIFQNIITAPGYSTAVRAMLILYITITSILFLMGSIQLTHTEIINRTIKVAIISALLHPEVSWNFFNEYLFIWFYEGTAYIIQILKNAANTGPGDSSILTFLTTTQITTKLLSLLLASWQGWIYILIYFIMLAFLTMVLFDATVLYLTAQVMTGLLICLAPIFIAFYLFESTKSFFENWLKQLIGYAVQSILVSAGILFLTMIIRNQIYNTLGFRVCLEEFPNMNIPGGGGLGDLLSGSDEGDAPVMSLFGWWFPQIPGWGDNPIRDVIPIPKAHFVSPQDAALGYGFKNSPINPGEYCKAYECVGMRYPDLPFLDPNNSYESRQMDILRSGNVVDFGGLFIIVVCVYLLHHFNSTVDSMAKFLSGTTGNAGDNRATASGVSSYAATPLKMAAAAIDQKSGFKGIRDKVNQKVHDFWDKKVVGAAARRLSNWHAKKLEAEALDSRWSPFGAKGSLLKAAESKYGISQSAAREFRKDENQSTYHDGLKNALNKELSGAQGDTDKASSKLLKSLSEGKSKDFEAMLAKKLYGEETKLSELSSAQRDSLKNIMEDKTVQDMLSAKQKEEVFRQAYLESYQDMGKGPLSRRDLKEQKRAIKADKVVAWQEEMKRLLSGGLINNEADQIQWKDDKLRTFNEQLADKEESLRIQREKRELDKLTIQAGRDIERPDFLAKLRAEDKEAAAKYDQVIEQNIHNDVLRTLKDSGEIKGDTYIKTKMTESEFNTMLDNVRAQGKMMLENDKYGRHESMYQDNPSALDEISKRKEHIDNAVHDEVKRLLEVRNSDAPVTHNTGVGDIMNYAKDSVKSDFASAEKVLNKIGDVSKNVTKAVSTKFKSDKNDD